MTDIVESSVWESGVYQLETDDPVLGGVPIITGGSPVTGHANAQAQQLANRTKWLYDNKVNTVDLANSSDPTKGAELVGFRQDAETATGRTLSDKLTEFVSVRDFGAVGDGLVDDTIAIQSAINYSAAKGVKVSLGNGTFIFSQIRFPSGFVGMFGEKSETSQLKHKAGSGSDTAMSWNNSRINGAVFHDFSVIGNSEPTEGNGFDLTGFSYADLRNIFIYYFNGDNFSAEGYLAPTDASTISNKFYNCRATFSVNGDGVKLRKNPVGTTGPCLIGWRFFGCYFLNNGGVGLNDLGGEDTQTYGCFVEKNLTNNINLDSSYHKSSGLYTESPAAPNDIKIGPNAKSFQIEIARSTWPLWQLITQDSFENSKKGRIWISGNGPSEHFYKNCFLTEWVGLVPYGVSTSGSAGLQTAVTDTLAVNGFGWSITIPANTPGNHGFFISLPGKSSNYFGKRVTVGMRLKTSGGDGLTTRIFTRIGATNNSANGQYYNRDFLQSADYTWFFADLVFSEQGSFTGEEDVSIFVLLSASSTAESSGATVVVDSLFVAEGAFSYPIPIEQRVASTRSASTTTLSNASSWVNIVNKGSPGSIFNSTNGLLYFATGSLPTSVWRPVNLSGDITPI